MSSTPDSPSVARELIAHSGALRRLARDLVGRSDADDIVPWTRDVLRPAGLWVALWKRDGKVSMREFALAAGATTTLRTER